MSLKFILLNFPKKYLSPKSDFSDVAVYSKESKEELICNATVSSFDLVCLLEQYFAYTCSKYLTLEVSGFCSQLPT